MPRDPLVDVIQQVVRVEAVDAVGPFRLGHVPLERFADEALQLVGNAFPDGVAPLDPDDVADRVVGAFHELGVGELLHEVLLASGVAKRVSA